MPTEAVRSATPLAARRVFRLSLTVALSLACGYALQLPLPYLAPIFGLMITAKPAGPMGLQGLVGLIVLVSVTMGAGLLLVPVLINYPFTGLLIVASGLFISNDLSVNKGKAAVGAFLTVGLTLLTAAGVASFVVALSVAKALGIGIAVAVLCQWIVCQLFPEDPVQMSQAPEKSPDREKSGWIALRATLIVMPAYLLALINPAMYLPIIMKSVSLGQQGMETGPGGAGRELLGSTLLGGFFAIVFWGALGLLPNLWMFFLWMLLFGLYYSGKIYGLLATRFPASFWINVVVTMLILLGPAVQDSDSGQDVYKAFAVRMSLYIGVTIYAWAAIMLLEHWRKRRAFRSATGSSAEEAHAC
jgi:hypothetical protein